MCRDKVRWDTVLPSADSQVENTLMSDKHLDLKQIRKKIFFLSLLNLIIYLCYQPVIYRLAPK